MGFSFKTPKMFHHTYNINVYTLDFVWIQSKRKYCIKSIVNTYMYIKITYNHRYRYLPWIHSTRNTDPQIIKTISFKANTWKEYSWVLPKCNNRGKTNKMILYRNERNLRRSLGCMTGNLMVDTNERSLDAVVDLKRCLSTYLFYTCLVYIYITFFYI